ncbi:MAG: carbohydrate kinase family protein [Roseiflexaceae bacterium]|nr:carbohydrate kinase family protein [Roseiflexaceae bacterium]
MTILVVGDANADLTATLPHFPHKGDDSPVSSLSWGGGGSAANTAVALARLNVPTRLLARVGSDPAAEVALRNARAAGVDLSYLQIEPHGATGLCYAVISPEGERTFFAFRGANINLTVLDASIPVHGISWLHLGGHALLEGPQHVSALVLIDAAVSRGIPISIDVCLPLLRSKRLDILALLPKLTILFANEPELQLLATGTTHGPTDLETLSEYAAELYRLGPETIVGKCGAYGCITADTRGVQCVPGFTVSVVDTNGCGDAFAAGFLSSWINGADPEACAMYGNVCGALAATHTGAAESLPHRATIDAFLVSHQNPLALAS